MTAMFLQEQRHQYHKESDIKEQASVFKPGHHRENGENNRHRTAQSDPTDENALPKIEAAKWQQAGKHRQWAGEENHPDGENKRRDGNRPQIGRRHQQPQNQEHRDLRQPG